MARPRQGIGFVQRGVVYTGVRLRDGGRKVWPVTTTDAPPEGVPLGVPWAKAVSLAYQGRYDNGQWDPNAVAEPTEPTTEEAEEPPSIVTVLDTSRDWVKTLAPSTAIDDGRRVEAYLPRAPLGSLELRAVTPADLRAFVTWLIEQPSRRGGNLASRTVRNVYDIVRRMYTWASSDDVKRVPISPCLVAPDNLPEIEDKHPEFRVNASFSRQEMIALISDPRLPSDRRVLYAVLFLTGCRFGEVAALRWRHWTREYEPLGRLVVALSIERNVKVEKRTKTGAVREVPVHPVLAKILTDWHASGWRDLFGRAPKPDDLLIPSREGRPRPVRQAHTRLQEDLDRLGLRHRRVHDTRRTFISLCRDDGARGDILRHITHGAKKRDIMDVYSTLGWATYCAEVACLQLDLSGPVPTPLASSVTGYVTAPSSDQAPDAENPENLAIHGVEIQRGGRDLNPSESHEVSLSALNCVGDPEPEEHSDAPDGRSVTGSVTDVTLRINLLYPRPQSRSDTPPTTVHCLHCEGTGRRPRAAPRLTVVSGGES